MIVSSAPVTVDSGILVPGTTTDPELVKIQAFTIAFLHLCIHLFTLDLGVINISI